MDWTAVDQCASGVMKVSVECRATIAEDEPCRFFMGARQVEASCVIDRWPGREHSYFKLRGDDGAIYILRRDAEGNWYLVLFEAARLWESGEVNQ